MLIGTMRRTSAALQRQVSNIQPLVVRLRGEVDESQLVGNSSVCIRVGSNHGQFLDFMNDPVFRPRQSIVGVMNHVLDDPTGDFADAFYNLFETNDKLRTLFYLYALKTVQMCQEAKDNVDELIRLYDSSGPTTARNVGRTVVRARFLAEMQEKAVSRQEMDEAVLTTANAIVTGLRDILFVTM